jgi:hypothetical protein
MSEGIEYLNFNEIKALLNVGGSQPIFTSPNSTSFEHTHYTKLSEVDKNDAF